MKNVFNIIESFTLHKRSFIVEKVYWNVLHTKKKNQIYKTRH